MRRWAPHLLLKVALFGAMWGMGNVSYGLTMRHLGMSLGIGVAIGVTLVVGTLVPPLMHGQVAMLFTTRGGLLTHGGRAGGADGRGDGLLCRSPEGEALSTSIEEFNLKLGLALAVMCGIFSSGMSFAIDAAKPMEAAALHLGVNPLYAALPSYVIIMGGGAVVNLALLLHPAGLQERPVPEARSGADEGATLMKNALLAATGGIMWYLQFFFYAWGAANIPQHLSYVNWMLHMSGYVLCGGLVGLALGEWAGVGGRPIRLLWAGIIIIIAAANLVGLGMAS